jgi:demethylspheroidene O-methyltransferase
VTRVVSPQAPLPPGAAHWSDGLLAWRDRLLASRRFRRWAQASVLTRWIARRRAAEVFDLVAGFVYSQVLLACVQLRAFDLLLQDGPQTPQALAQRWQLPLAASERLVRAAVALRLLEARPHGRVGLGPLGAPLAGDAGLAAMVAHHAALYRDLAEPLALLKGEGGAGAAGLAAYWPYAGTQAPGELPAERLAAYSQLMAASQPLVAEQVLQTYPLHRHRRLLDVGGGIGEFACRAARAAPELQVQVFDLPGVVPEALRRFEREGLAGRCSAVGGDFFRDPLPAGADLVTLLRVAHDHDDARVLHLLRAIRQALAPGGRLLLAEPLADTPGAERMGHAYFGFYLLAMGRGEPRSEARLRDMLAEAGFIRVRRLATTLPLQASALLAETPG